MGISSFIRGHAGLVLAVVIGALVDASSLHAQAPAPFEINSYESAIVDSSAQVLREIMSIPGKGIPASLLANAEGIVIVPGMLKGGFVIGAKHGRGVVLVHDPASGWQLPQFVTITGGSIGWQAGIQATDLVLVFKTKRSVQGLLTGKFTIGADAAAAAGPIGREASAATDATLKSEIYSYSRSRGIFAGLALDGSKLQIDQNATLGYYRTLANVQPGQTAPLPASSLRLLREINKHATQVVNSGASDVPIVAQPPATTVPADASALRRRLAGASQRLNALVDEQWKGYLALPVEVYSGDRLPSTEMLEQALGRYHAVAFNPNYAALASRAEFRETLELLEQLHKAMPRSAIDLPPPPVSQRP